MEQKGSSEINYLGLRYEEEKNTSSKKSRENGLLIFMSEISHRSQYKSYRWNNEVIVRILEQFLYPTIILNFSLNQIVDSCSSRFQNVFYVYRPLKLCPDVQSHTGRK